MEQKPEVLELADSIELVDPFNEFERDMLANAAAELRRLYKENHQYRTAHAGFLTRERWNSNKTLEIRDERDRLRAENESLREQNTLVDQACARLEAENEALRKAYRKMRNAAAGYSNYCEESASTRRCERDYTEAEELFRAIPAAMKEKP